MPRYHFNAVGTAYGPDPEGSELPDWKAARVEAMMLMGEILRDTARNDDISDGLHVEVMDVTSMILFRLDFSIVASAAIPRVSVSVRSR